MSRPPDIREIARLPSPAPKPQSLGWDGSTLWMGSRQTRRVYHIEVESWKVTWDVEAPGTPWGLAVLPGELRVICGENGTDDRILRRCIPGQGFDTEYKVPCPDDSGSQLGWDGKRLHLSQWYRKRILSLDEKGGVERIIEAPHGICGQVIVNGVFYLATTDDEATTDFWLTRIDLSGKNPKVEDLARIPFGARALAFDGRNFWTNHREQDQIVCFAHP